MSKITIENINKQLMEFGYYAEDELIYDAFNGLLMFDNNSNIGQDIYALCLEGPPGAGKTEFAKVYTRMANEFFSNDVEMVDYQCDATTGKTELFEDINISAAISGDAENVNIPGKLVEAIKKVNDGKKVVLFIDEYDKAREETDAFLLQFLQSGKINSTQHGDLVIEDKYKSNLQVILCKNDMREELSGPLSRRIRILRLDYMKPEIFGKVATRVLVTDKVDKVDAGLMNLVLLMYDEVYNNKEVYDRLPSCSEMLIAIQDADRLLKRANAPRNIIYNTIIRNMFKNIDDIKTFESKINNGRLKTTIEEMRKVEKTEKFDVNSIIKENIFPEETKNLAAKFLEMDNLINSYSEKFSNSLSEVQMQNNSSIKLGDGQLVSQGNKNIARNFNDENEYVKRGVSILDITNREWTEVGSVSMSSFDHYGFVKQLSKTASNLDIIIYENGILIESVEDYKLAVFANSDKSGKLLPSYTFVANSHILPATSIEDMSCFADAMSEYSEGTANIKETAKLEVDALVYNNVDLRLGEHSELMDVYKVLVTGEANINSLIDDARYTDIKEILKISDSLRNTTDESKMIK